MCGKIQKQAFFELQYTLTVNNAVMNFYDLLGTNANSAIFLSNFSEKKTRITKIEAFIDAQNRGANNSGSLAGQVNAFQIEFEFLDISLSRLRQSVGKSKDSTILPFSVPLIKNRDVFKSFVNQTIPVQNYSVDAFGIAVTSISMQIQNSIVPTCVALVSIGITYDEL